MKARASEQAPWNQWRMVMIDVDNKLPMYVQNEGEPFFYIDQSQDYPRDGDSAGFMAWLDKTSGQHFNPQRTLIFAQYRSGDPLPLGYLSVDHQTLTSQPDNGDRLMLNLTGQLWERACSRCRQWGLPEAPHHLQDGQAAFPQDV